MATSRRAKQLEQRQVVGARSGAQQLAQGRNDPQGAVHDRPRAVTLSPARRARPLRSTSPERIGRPPAASASPASRGRTASPARCGSAAHPAASETSASDAAKTYAKPPYERYPIPPSATTSTAPDRGSSGCSDSSFTATTGARAATSELENPPSKPSGPPSWSTSTRSEPPSGPRPHKRSSPSSEQHQRHATQARNRESERHHFSAVFHGCSSQWTLTERAAAFDSACALRARPGPREGLSPPIDQLGRSSHLLQPSDAGQEGQTRR